MNTFVKNNFTISNHETMNPFLVSRKINKTQQNALVFITHLLPLRIVMVNIQQ